MKVELAYRANHILDCHADSPHLFGTTGPPHPPRKPLRIIFALRKSDVNSRGDGISEDGHSIHTGLNRRTSLLLTLEFEQGCRTRRLVPGNAVAIYDLGLSSIYAKSPTHSANASGRETFRTFGVRDG